MADCYISEKQGFGHKHSSWLDWMKGCFCFSLEGWNELKQTCNSNSLKMKKSPKSTCRGSPALAPRIVGENHGRKIFSQITCREEDDDNRGEPEGRWRTDVMENCENKGGEERMKNKREWRGERRQETGWRRRGGHGGFVFMQMIPDFSSNTHTHTVKHTMALSVSWLAGGGSAQVDLRGLRSTNQRAACHQPRSSLVSVFYFILFLFLCFLKIPRSHLWLIFNNNIKIINFKITI